MGPMGLPLDDMQRRYEEDAQISGGVIAARARQARRSDPAPAGSTSGPRRRTKPTPPPPVEQPAEPQAEPQAESVDETADDASASPDAAAPPETT
jgi:hypothetical protein